MKRFTKKFSELDRKSTAIAGGKGASLGEMTQAGISVPPGLVVLASSFDQFIDETGLGVEIEAFLHEVDHKDINSVEKISTQIQDLIRRTEFPVDIGKEIKSAFSSLDTEFVAVRSSATAEDSSVASWAGELESYLNTNKDNLLENVKKCWASLFTPRAIFYRFEKKLHEKHVSVAVVVQKMVQSEVSGICFTVHPVTRDLDQMVIEAGWGLGEAIVGGKITPDTFVVKKLDLPFQAGVDQNIEEVFDYKRNDTKYSEKDYEILESYISEQTVMIVREKNSVVEKDVPQGMREKQKISNEQIIKLAGICQNIERHYNYPQDIEWALENDKFFIVQSRPITTLG